MATDDQIERVRSLCECKVLMKSNRAAIAAVLDELAKLKRLAPILQRAVDDQRPMDIFNGVVEWHGDAKAALAALDKGSETNQRKAGG